MQHFVLPLRVPDACDLAAQLSHWLDDSDDEDSSVATSERNPRPDFRAAECEADLEYLDECRSRLTVSLNLCQGNLDETANSSRLPLLQDYAAALAECCSRGFPVTDLEGEGLTFTWKCVADSKGLTTASETHHSLAWERANVLYNIAVIYAYQASTQPLNSRPGWTKAGLLLQQAATVVQYIREKVLTVTGPLHSSLALSSNFLLVWESYLLAEAQRAAYQTFRAQPRPKHFMLAKLAAAAAPLYQTVEDLCSTQDARFAATDLILNWEDSVRALGMWMTAVTEYHQSIVHKEKNERGLELARLEGALKFGSFCKEFCESTDMLDSLAQQVLPVLEEIDERFEIAETENNEQFHESIPEHDELPEVAPQLSVKTDPENISKLLPALSKPLFAGVMDPALRRYADMFRAEIQKVVTQTVKLAEEKTEAARNSLAVVNLPHSLTAYRQEQNGGGIPDELWERVEDVQRDRKVDLLIEDLWKVRGYADSARSTFKRCDDHLEEDLEMDALFRQQHPNFEGHDVNDIQKSFRQALQNYHRLMESARESDDLLIRRCEILESDPKFRLLKLQKSQLDRLLPAGRGGSAEIDVSLLSNYLVDLSALFNERDSLLHTMKEEAKTYNISEDLSSIGQQASGDAYRKVVDNAKASFHGTVEEIKVNLEKQTKLLYKIMQENDQFMRVRDQSHNASGTDSPINKIEDALDEIDQFSKHLKEGKTFYDVVIPKLEKLHQQVEDVSCRLSQERLDYQEYASQPRNEPTGRRSPGNRHRSNGGPSAYRPRGSSPYNQRRPTPQSNMTPGAQSVSLGRTEVRVDDEKVANLVAMDFDPDKVVAALKKYDNDLEQALNDLLSF